MTKNSDSSKPQIEVYKRMNRLKIKAGADPNQQVEGMISPEKIRQADELVTDFCKDCPKMVSGVLDKLNTKWRIMSEAVDGEDRDAMAEEMFTLAHEIKDVAGLCGYVLMSDFAESLRDYVVEKTLNPEAQRVIIQAHVDVMNQAYKKNVKDDGGPVAAELKDAVRVAIDKYILKD